MVGEPCTMSAPSDNTIHTEDQDAGVCVAGSSLSSSKQPLFVLQGNEATKSNKFNSSSGYAYFAPVAVSAPMTTANILTQANLSTLRSAEVPVDLNLRKVSHCANRISLGNNNNNHNNSTAATIIDGNNANCAGDNTYDTHHGASNTSTLDLVIRKNSAKRISTGADVRYRECLKNHAANMGGYAVDGCGEFMWSGEESSFEALKCAACGCHRNFHRREVKVNGESSITAAVSSSMGLLALAMNPSSTNSSNSGYGQQDHKNNTSSALSGSGGSGGQLLSRHCSRGHSGPMLTHPHHHRDIHAWMQGDNKLMAGVGAIARAGHHAGPADRHLYVGGLPCHGAGGIISGHCRLGGAHVMGTGKRFRTKFTMEQREKLLAFSEKVGWRIHKEDEAAVQHFCSENGVKRHVLKVWMHNNKNTFGKKLVCFSKVFDEGPKSST